MNKETQIIKTAFAPVEIPPHIELTPVSEEDIVDTLIIDTYETDSEGNVTPVTKQIVTGKKNRKAYIESFNDDVGLTHILEKIGQGAISEEKYSILNGQAPGSVTDLRQMNNVKNYGDLQALADKARVTYSNLDPELKKNMSFAEFCKTIKNQDLVDYVNKKNTKSEVKGDAQ